MLRIGIIGAAQIAPSAIVRPASRLDGIEVVAIAAARAGAAADFAVRHGIPRAYDSYEALIADPEVDLVYNALAVRDHVPLSIAALEAGKHVLCEKPIAMNAAEAARLVEAAQRTGKRAIEAFHYRHHPLFLSLLRLLDEGTLGTIRSIASEISDVRAFDPASVLHDPTVGGGALRHAGCYAVDWTRALVGEEPEVEWARSARNPLGADSRFEAELSFPGGVLATIEVAMAPGSAIRPGNRVAIRGDRGSVRVENLIAPHGGHSVDLRIAGEPARVFTVAGETSYEYQLAAVASALGSGEPLPSEGDQQVLAMSVIDALYRVVEEGKDQL
ncbi:MAG: putative dehydrogenase [Frondihabitans sp.]|nr:putative dehydrogenase [Frondihabitans sp.]